MEVNTTTTTNPINMYDYLNNLFLNKSVFFVIFFIIVAYFILFYYLGDNKNSDNLFSSLGLSSVLQLYLISALFIISFILHLN